MLRLRWSSQQWRAEIRPALTAAPTAHAVLGSQSADKVVSNPPYLPHQSTDVCARRMWRLLSAVVDCSPRARSSSETRNVASFPLARAGFLWPWSCGNAKLCVLVDPVRSCLFLPGSSPPFSSTPAPFRTRVDESLKRAACPDCLHHPRSLSNFPKAASDCTEARLPRPRSPCRRVHSPIPHTHTPTFFRLISSLESFESFKERPDPAASDLTSTQCLLPLIPRLVALARARSRLAS